MDRTQLLQHFEALAETPEAVPKVRALVLDLAEAKTSLEKQRR